MSDQNNEVTAPDGDEISAAQPFYKHPPGFRRRRARNWFFLGLTYASYYLCRYNLSIVAPDIKAPVASGGLGLSNFQYGLVDSSRSIMYAIGQFCNGLFSDRLGGKLSMTIGAIGTIILNYLFGLFTYSDVGFIVVVLMIIRGVDGYVQAFGSPGMVKINTAWFRKQERGTFAGIFGGMIQLGAIGVGLLGRALATGLVIPLLFFTLKMPALDWRYMFFVPPVITLVVIILMNVAVKNHPEQAGFRIVHDDESHDDDPHEKLPISYVFRKIASNPIAWINAGAYFCTGFVRTAISAWWVVYLAEVWHENRKGAVFLNLAWILPLTAFLGSFTSGLVSDKLFKGRRAPIASSIYMIEAAVILFALLFSEGILPGANAFVLAVLLVGVNITCNSSHSIIGTAAAMDLGGRKMAGFASGVIDSFQYFGATLAGFGLGALLEATATKSVNAEGKEVLLIDGAIWFGSMLPFALLGACLMGYLWVAHRGKGTRGT